jgi:hypothetical protein
MAILRIATFLAAISAAAGCSSVSQPPCAFSCAADGLCPTGYSCAVDGVCHRDDGQEMCDIPSQIDAARETGDQDGPADTGGS